MRGTGRQAGERISIHAPRRERPHCQDARIADASISIHAPRRERLTVDDVRAMGGQFQSTLPGGSDR